MNYLALLIIIVFISTISQAYLCYKRFSNLVPYIFATNFFNSSKYSTHDYSQRNNFGLQFVLTFVFFVSPFMLYKCLKSIQFENNTITFFLMCAITTISFSSLLFSLIKLQTKIFKLPSLIRNRSQSNTVKTSFNNISGKLQSIAKHNNRKKDSSILKKQFVEFLMVVKKFDLYDTAGAYFNLGGYKIKDKGRTITSAQACFILTFFWYHEVLKSNAYTREVVKDIWDQWELQLYIKAPLTKGNWDTFKNNYLHNVNDNTKFEDLKESNFYTSFRAFYIKNHTLVN